MVTTQKIWFLPILNFVWFAATFLITYSYAVQLELVKGVVPLLSDIGAKPPVSCIFSQMLSIGTFISLLVMYIRFRYVQEEIKIKSFDYYMCLMVTNWVSFFFGAVAIFGLTLVANFQLIAVQVVHLAGVMLASGFACFYQMTQTVITFMVSRDTGPGMLAIGRMFASVLTMTILGLFGVFYTMCLQTFYEEEEDNPTWVLVTNKAFVTHMVSALLQWTLALTQIVFLTTFSFEFMEVTISEPKVQSQQP